MKMVLAYIQVHKTSEVVGSLHRAGFKGLTVYTVHGLSAEDTKTFYGGHHPFETDRLPSSTKLELLCEDGDVQKAKDIIVQNGRSGFTGDGLIAVMPVDSVQRIREGG